MIKAQRHNLLLMIHCSTRIPGKALRIRSSRPEDLNIQTVVATEDDQGQHRQGFRRLPSMVEEVGVPTVGMAAGPGARGQPITGTSATRIIRGRSFTTILRRGMAEIRNNWRPI